MDLIFLAIIPVIITIPVTAMLCRMRIARRQRVAYGTMLLGVFIVTLIWLVCVSRGDCFSQDFWASLNAGSWTRITADRVLQLKFAAFCAVISVLPAFGVVDYHQKRSKRNSR